MPGAAAIATSPPIPPFNEANRSTLPRTQRDRHTAATTPAAPARFELTKMLLSATASGTPVSPVWEPALNARNPNQIMNAPRVTMGTLFGGVCLTVPSGRNLPRRAPTTRTAASAAQPPVEWTIVEPARSLKPIAASQPPPQVQDPITG